MSDVADSMAVAIAWAKLKTAPKKKSRAKAVSNTTKGK